MNRRLVFVFALGISARLPAQTTAELVALGDMESAAGKSANALRHYQAAIASDSAHAGALWRAAREVVDLGEFDPPRRDSLYRLGLSYARRAADADPANPTSRFMLARSLGRYAQSVPAKERMKYATMVREEALAALQLDSAHTGALHVMGVWNAEVMRLNGFVRFMAKKLLGGQIFGEASWDHATRYLERAVELEPQAIVHTLALADVYRDRRDKQRAVALYRRVLALNATSFNDRHYKATAERQLAAID